MSELNVSHWLGSSPLALSDLRGNIVVLDFWSMDEPDEVNATRQMNALAREYGEKGVVVIGIHPHTVNTGAVETFLRERGIAYPVAIDAPPPDEEGLGATFESYGIRVLNHDVIIAPDGTVRSGIRVLSLERELLHLLANR